MSEEKLDSIVYKPEEKEKKTTSIIWLLPLLVLCILAWSAYESYTQKGTYITVSFKSAEGLKAGTPLQYKGLTLGKVKGIDITGLNSVKVNILVNSEAVEYVATDKVGFWMKKPRVTLTKITGLGTILSGNVIEVYPKVKSLEEFESAKPKFDFVGLESKPSYELNQDGYYVSILANNSNNVEVETPIFYKSFQIGEVVEKKLKDDKIYLTAYIYNKYDDLVNESSKFFMNKFLKVNFGAGGLKIEASSLYSAIIGGITVQTPKKEAKKIAKDKHYTLYNNKDEIIQKTPITIYLPSGKDIGKNTDILYKGIQVGEITSISLKDEKVIAKANIYKKYDYLLTKNTTIKLEKVKIDLDGADNLSNIITGNYLSIEYKKGEPSYSFIVDNSTYKKDAGDIILTLNAKSLNSITKKSKIYFKNIAVGKVLSYSLSKDFENVKIKILIKKQYKKLINDKTLFYDMSSKLLELKGLNIDINNIGFDPLLNGAISLVNIEKTAKLTKKNMELYGSFKDVEKIKREKTKGFYINAYFDNSFDLKEEQAINYKNQEIGFVKAIKFSEKRSKVKIFIYSKYKKYITKKSRFYKKAPIKLDASLGGIIFEVDNLTALLKGSIELDNSAKSIAKYSKIYSSKDGMLNDSNTVSIVFKDVDGLKNEFSKVIYKGVEIGKVTSISLNTKNQALVKVQIFKNFQKFTKKGTIFYLKKPKVSLNEVKNISSTIMPVYLSLIPSKQKTQMKNFKGYDDFDDIPKSDEGVILKVVSNHPTSLNKDAPVYYKNIQIGKVKNIKLSSDGTKILIDCLVYNNYKHLIRINSTFHDISGFKLKFSIFGGSKVETNTLTSILKGGLMVVTPYKYKNIATPKDKFILKKELKEGWENISPSIKK